MSTVFPFSQEWERPVQLRCVAGAAAPLFLSIAAYYSGGACPQLSAGSCLPSLYVTDGVR